MNFAPVILLNLITCISVFAQESPIKIPFFVVQQYTDEDGLPQNSIKGISKDKNGFVWLATEEGLSRYDGQRFMNFKGPDADGDDNRVNTLLPAVKKSPRYADFFAICVNKNALRVTNKSKVEATENDEHTLIRLAGLPDNGKETVSILRNLPYYDQSPAAGHVSLLSAGAGTVYRWKPDSITALANRKQLFRVAAGDTKYLFMIGSQVFSLDSTGRDFRKITPEKRVEVELKGDILTNPKFGSRDFFSRFSASSSNKPSLYMLYWNNVSNQAFLYLNQSIYQLTSNPDGLHTRLLISGVDMANLHITTIMLDEQRGTVYLGSSTNGLFILKPNPFQRFTSVSGDNVFYAQTVGGYNAVVLPQGLELNLEADGYSQRQLMKHMSWLSPDKAYIARDDSGNFYINRHDKLIKVNKSGETVYQSPGRKDMKAIYCNGKNRLWLSDADGNLFLADPARPKALRQLVRTAGNEVICMRETGGKTLWIGTRTGLYRLDIRTGKRSIVRGTEGVNIRSMYFNRHGLWMTTYHSGLLFWPRGKELVHLPLDKDEYLSLAHCIVEDPSGIFWVTTNKGLFKIRTEDLLAYASGWQKEKPFYFFYDINQGLGTNEFNGGCQPCAAVLGNGQVSLPSIKGLQWFNPESIQTDLPDNGLFVSTLTLDNQPFTENPEISLPGGFNEFRVEVSSPYYGNPKNLVLEYAVERPGAVGLTWLPVLAQNTISLSRLPFGSYTLKIRKRNGFGFSNYTYRDLNFSVAPFWYETLWFRGLLFIAFTIGLIAVIRYRTNYLLRKDEEMKLYKQAHLQGRMLAVINHDIQTPLRYLVNSLEQVNNYLASSVTDPVIRETSRVAYMSARQIRKFTGNLLVFIKTQINGSGSILRERISVKEILDATVEFFTGTISSMNVHVQMDVRDDLTVESNQHLVSVVLHNLIDNALKNTPEGEVKIFAAFTGGGVEVVIADNGLGIKKKTADWLNSTTSSEDFFTEPDTPEDIGIGLLIVKDLCDMLNIQLRIDANAGKGTTVKLLFPDGHGRHKKRVPFI